MAGEYSGEWQCREGDGTTERRQSAETARARGVEEPTRVDRSRRRLAAKHRRAANNLSRDPHPILLIKLLRVLQWYRCAFCRVWDAGTLMRSQQVVAQGSVSKFDVTHGKSILMGVDPYLAMLDEG